MPSLLRINVEFFWSMNLRRKVMAVTLAVASVAAPALASVTNLESSINDYLEEAAEVNTEQVDNELIALEAVLNEVTNPLSEVVITTRETKEPRWQGKNFTEAETAVLNYFQEYGITDRAALATLLGNVKQESRFITNICEGGARVSYHQCRRGGFGLIQWTTVGRYTGLGAFARKYSCNPSKLDCQVRYMINENQFQKILPDFEGGGWTVRQYMVPAFYWLGWGIKGNRELFAYDYVKKLVYT